MNNENNKEILCGIQKQISSFDNKASILLSVVGIVFALSISFLSVFHSDYYVNSQEQFKNWYMILFIAFSMIALLSVVAFIMVIFPRKNKTKDMCANYYLDIVKMNDDELTERLDEFSCDGKQIISQIKINSKICSKKHIWLKIGLYLQIPFIVLLFILIILTIIL